MTIVNTGLGFCGVGTSYAGTGVPGSMVVEGTPLQQENGLTGSSRYIDPSTGDYVIDANGRFQGMNSIQQMVYLALKTVKGSSAVTSLGQNFSSIKTISQNTIAQIQNEVNLALQRLISVNAISLVNVDVKRNGDNQVLIHIRWKDISSNNISEFIV